MELTIFNTKIKAARKASEEISRHLKSCEKRYPEWVERSDGAFKGFTQQVSDERIKALQDAQNVLQGYLSIIDRSKPIEPTKYILDEEDARMYFEHYIQKSGWDAKGIHPKTAKKQYGNDFIDLELSKTYAGHWAVDVFWLLEPEKEKELPKRDLLTRIPMPVNYTLFEFLMLAMSHQYQ